MPHTDPERLRAIKTLPQLLAYLRNDLDWPIETEDVEELTFEYQPQELGLDTAAAVKIKEIKQLRPLTGNQPWGIFFINFEKKRLPVVIMRRILRALVLKKRDSSNKSERQAWQPSDLLFISAYGEETDRAITFAHFVENEDYGNLAELRVLGWDDDDTPLKYDYIAHTLQEKLRWRDEFEENHNFWRQNWREAFVLRHREVITTSKELALTLAGLAKRIRGRVRSILRCEDGFGQIRKLQRAFQQGLIHDLTDDDFADMLAQTVTYGLFSVAVRRTFPGEGTAVIRDDVPNLIFTSPFLKDMMGIFLGIKSRKGRLDFDELGVTDVEEVLRSPDTHMEAVLRDFGNRTRQEDPVIHFYELFLTEYDKERKVQRGVFYTPQPVVSYIVRSVHELLQTEFGLEDGLASTISWGEMLKKHPDIKLPPLTDEHKEKRTISPDEPFVQVLDPATGTGTFLVEVIDVIYKTMVAKWKKAGKTDAQIKAAWNDYVPKNLLPRLYGYELMMAPYAIAHMKIGLKLSETGYCFASDERARIYLTNALEPKVRQLPAIGFDALAHEAAAVNEVKWYKHFTVVIGNPPYSNYGKLNKNLFILGLLKDYKRGLDEKKLNLDDDFIKFIRFSQATLIGTGLGIHGFITNNVYLDGLTHRQMRRYLLDHFTALRLLNLHGDQRKKEMTPDGSRDENVFDIMQGVAIALGVKAYKHSGENDLEYTDLWGLRDEKYRQLTLGKIPFHRFQASSPNFFFKESGENEGEVESEYSAWWRISDTSEGISGIETKRDHFAIDISRSVLQQRIRDFVDGNYSDAERKRVFELQDNEWVVEDAVKRLRRDRSWENKFVPCLYRPFDQVWIIYHGVILSRDRGTLMAGMTRRNLGLIAARQSKEPFAVLVTNCVCTHKIVTVYDRSFLFPLYKYPNDAESATRLAGFKEGQANFSVRFIEYICNSIRLKWRSDGVGDLIQNIGPEDIFHYAYAVFHSPGYRSRYAEFLKIDFPRLPWTSSLDLFRALAKLGGELVALHLMESPKLDKHITKWVGGKNPEVEKVTYSDETVWIDKAQAEGFRGVPEPRN